MKRRKHLTALLCALALVISLSPAASAAAAPEASNNANRMSLFDPLNGDPHSAASYLYANSKGGVTRVEYRRVKQTDAIDSYVLVEEYNRSFQLVTSRKLPMELFMWGGFFAGSTYNFLIFGQDNPQESDSVEVLRVVKYSKDWQRLGEASFYGKDTKEPFAFGSFQCAEYGDHLAIHTCHTMYKARDGLNHQACMNLIIQESTMTENIRSGKLCYVSHSFDQYIMADQGGNVITVDLGDGHPRGVELHKVAAFAEKLAREETILIDIPGKTGDNSTGISVGGLAETGGSYVTLFTKGVQKTEKCFAGDRDIILAYTDKNTLASRLVNVTANAPKLDKDYRFYLGTPLLVPTGLSGGYILWSGCAGCEANGTLYYAAYSDNGTIGPIQTAKGFLSDCQPVLFNGKLTWYATKESTPVFYTLDASGVKAVKAASAPGAAELPRVEKSSVPAPGTPEPCAAEPVTTASKTDPQKTVAVPELRCAGCGYLMAKEGERRVIDLNNGNAPGGHFFYCAKCNSFAYCQPCANKPGTEARYLQHENACQG